MSVGPPSSRLTKLEPRTLPCEERPCTHSVVLRLLTADAPEKEQLCMVWVPHAFRHQGCSFRVMARRCAAVIFQRAWGMPLSPLARLSCSAKIQLIGFRSEREGCGAQLATPDAQSGRKSARTTMSVLTYRLAFRALLRTRPLPGFRTPAHEGAASRRDGGTSHAAAEVMCTCADPMPSRRSARTSLRGEAGGGATLDSTLRWPSSPKPPYLSLGGLLAT